MVCIVCLHFAKSPVRNDAVNHLDQAVVPTRTLLELRNTTCESYYILLVCPSCWRSAWISLRKRAASREGLLDTVGAFQCPVHGLFGAYPLQGDEDALLPCPAG